MTTARTSIAATRATPATMASAADALRAEEVKRTRDVLRIGWIVAGGVAGAVLLSPGNPTIRNALLVVLAIGIVGSVWMHAQLAQPQSYSPSRMNLLALAALASASANQRSTSGCSSASSPGRGGVRCTTA